MKKKLLFTFILFYLGIQYSTAQSDSVIIAEKFDMTSIGLGGGLDYGGFGANLLYYPQKNIGLFAGGGYALAGFGYNVGLKYRFHSSQSFKKFTFYLTAMYGYNAAVSVANANQYNKLFYGFTAGLGGDLKAWPEKKGYWSFALLIPIRDPEAADYIDDLKNNHGAQFNMELIPIGISIGYHFIINWH